MYVYVHVNVNVFAFISANKCMCMWWMIIIMFLLMFMCMCMCMCMCMRTYTRHPSGDKEVGGGHRDTPRDTIKTPPGHPTGLTGGQPQNSGQEERVSRFRCSQRKDHFSRSAHAASPRPLARNETKRFPSQGDSVPLRSHTPMFCAYSLCSCVCVCLRD